MTEKQYFGLWFLIIAMTSENDWIIVAAGILALYCVKTTKFKKDKK